MDLRLVRYFVAIADSGTVTAAAAALHLTQPSLSRQVRQLERQIGTQLFAREPGRLRLNAAGQAFLPVAQRLLAQADTAEQTARAIATGQLQHLTISAPGTTLTDVVAPFLATLTDDDPMPAVREEVPASVYGALDRGADLAIGTTPWPSRLDGTPIADLPVWAYVRTDDTWAGKITVTVEELVRRTLLLQTGEFHPRRALDQAITAAGLAYGDVHEFSSAEVAQAVAASGRGVAVVSDDPRFDLLALRIRNQDRPVHIRLYAAWEHEHHGARQIRSIAERLRAFCIARYGTEVAPAGPNTFPRSH